MTNFMNTVQLPHEVILAGAQSRGHWRLEYHPDLILLHDVCKLNLGLILLTRQM